MTSIVWTLTNTKYEVSTVNHLLCIASIGVGFTSTGSVPTNFSTAAYIQTTNIDCIGVTMTPIGNVLNFTGSYNGNNFEIKNWQNNQTTTANNQGLFGTANGTIENINMTGVIKVKGGSSCGAIGNTSGTMRNISVVFDQGSLITGTGNVGGVFGNLGNSNSMGNIRVSGIVNITGTNAVGGVMGYVGYTPLDNVIISITGNITGTSNVGGIVGNTSNLSLSGAINSMIGNIVCSGSTVGGISGTTQTCTYKSVTNNMKGNITGSSYVGGIYGNCPGGAAVYQDIINIMEGNIISTSDSTYSGGIGYNSNLVYTRNIVAMKGNTPYLLMNESLITISTNITNNIYSNKFGMTVNNATLLYDPYLYATVVSLNYFPAELSTSGSIKMWDPIKFVPYWVHNYTGSDNAARSIRLTNGVNVQSLTVSNLTTTNQFANVTIAWTAIAGYSYYRLLINAEDSNDVVAVSSTSSLTGTANNALCGTKYIGLLHVSTDNSTFVDSGIRVSFTTANCSSFNKNPTQTTTLSPTWTSVTNITNYRVKIKGLAISETIGVTSTTTLNGVISNLNTNTYYILTLEGSSDNVTFVRLSLPQAHTTLPLVIWTTNAGGKYQVSSTTHLNAIANYGNGYVSGLTFPPNYATASYIQTANIDCTGVTMIPIGLVVNFTGSYDGANFEIQNWQNNQTTTANNQGLFGTANGTFENIKMTGVIKVKGGSSCGAIGNTSGTMRNITVIFDQGSLITGTGNVGGVFGNLGNSNSMGNIRVSGIVNITGTNAVGGVMGYVGYTPLDNVIISITGNITGTSSVGGIVGNTSNLSLSGAINSMIGNIICSGSTVGGISGTTQTCTYKSVTNNMKGNITGSSYVGGIYGNCPGGAAVYQDIINIMEGDIVSTSSSTYSGGIGYNSNLVYTRNIVAMKGNTPYLLMNESLITTSTNIINNIYSNKFGMTVNNATLLYDPYLYATVVSLNYFPAELSTSGSIKMWDPIKFVPYWVHNYTGSDNVARSIRLTNGVNVQSLTVSNLTTTNQFANVTIAWTAVAGYSYYRLLINAEDSTDVVAVSSTTSLSGTANNAFCGTKYIGLLHVSTDNSTFIDSGIRVSFTTANCSAFNKNPTQITTLSPIWTSVTNITNYRVKIKGLAISETIGVPSTTSLNGVISNLNTNTAYTITLEGSSDNITFIRLSFPQSHTTLPLVIWTIDSNNKYEVTNITQLVALANNGNGYSSGLIYPANYATASYIQKNNIDCSGTTMIPIGNIINFNGSYNGNNFEIQNWQNNQSTTAVNQGFMGSANGTFENVVMTGIIKVKGGSNCGAFAGSISGTIRNIAVTFSGGSLISGSTTVGGLIGALGSSSNMNNLRVSGFVTITGTSNVGGFLGSTFYTPIKDVIVSFTGDVTGTTNVGGLVGLANNLSLSGAINNIKGNVTGTGTTIGGMIGVCTTCTLNSLINNMTGNITGTSYVGGIFGNSDGTLQQNQDIINSMEGNIISTVDSTYSGGIGYNTSQPRYIRNVVAMKGNTPHVLMNENLVTVNLIANINNNVHSNRFGMKVNSVNYTVSNAFYNFVTLDVYPTTELTTGGSIKFFDTLRFLPYWTYTYTGSDNVTRTISGKIDVINYTLSVDWKLSNGIYEIPSDIHLITFLRNGLLPAASNSLYTYSNSGSTPSNWFSSSYKQTSNIDMKNQNLMQFSLSANSFSGLYDGQNYNIQNLLYMNQGVSKTCGLFTNINGATIKNITLSSNLNVYANSNFVRGNMSFGGIVHTASNNNIIENCKVLTNGSIKIDNTLGLICNNTTGSNNIINKCYTNHVGTIDSLSYGSNSVSGIILGTGYSSNNNYVLHCTNENNGDAYLGEYFGSGIAGTNATVFGCLNKSTGNLSGNISGLSYNVSGIIGNGNAIGCINSMQGNIAYSNSIDNAGISCTGSINYCINNMKGNLKSNSSYGLGKSGKITNSLNYMLGDTFDVIGGNVSTSSNNYCAMKGNSYAVVNSDYNRYYGTLIYGLSNQIAKLKIRDDVWNVFQSNQFINYYNDISLPVLQPKLTVNVNNSNYIGPASNWQVSFPNNNALYNDFKYIYDLPTQSYKLFQISKSNIASTQSTLTVDGTNSNLPYYLYDFAINTNKNVLKSNLDSILSSNAILSNLTEASFFNFFNTQLSSNNYNSNSTFDIASLSNSLVTYKDTFKPALKKTLDLLVSDVKIIKNFNNDILDSNIKNRYTDKLYVNSNTSLPSNVIDQMFSSSLDLLLLDTKKYTLNLNNRIIEIDTTNSLSGSVSVKYNNIVKTLSSSSNNNIYELEYSSNNFVAFELTGLGSATLAAYNLSNIAYNLDIDNNYEISSLDQLLCFANDGYNYHVFNDPPIDFSLNNFIQKTNIDCGGVINVVKNATFAGIYDGSNNSIINLKYSNDIINNKFALFKSINNSTIKNTNIGGFLNVYGITSNLAANCSYGGLVHAANNNCMISNCHVNATGAININDSCSLICNNMTGTSNIITNCGTEFNGNINCANNCGIILANGYSISSSHILYSSNNSKGNITVNSGTLGGLAGQNVTVFGCTNSMTGNLTATNVGGILFDGRAIASVNRMQGNIVGNNNTGGIISKGICHQCINGMIGNINGEIITTGGISGPNGTVNNSLSTMKGDISGLPIGGSNNRSNICAQYGKTTYSNFSNSNDFAVLDYGYDNSITNTTVMSLSNINTLLVDNLYKSTSYYKYNINFALPSFTQTLSFNINNTSYTNESPAILYPNVAGNKKIAAIYNLYIRRPSDNALIKLNVANFNTLNISDILLNYIVPLDTISFTFDWEDSLQYMGNIGIGTTTPTRALDILGDINYTGSIFNSNNIEVMPWYTNSNSDVYYDNGNVGIGTSEPSYMLDVNGDVKAISYIDFSDKRLKTNIKDDSLGLDFIKFLKPKLFRYINDNKLKHGLIAQDLLTNSELAEPDTEFVDKDKNNYFTVQMTSFIGPMVNALKEINDTNALLKEKIKALVN